MDPKWVSQKEDGQRTCHQGIPTHLVIGKAVPSSVAGVHCPATKTRGAQFWNKDVKGDVLMGTLKLFLS